MKITAHEFLCAGPSCEMIENLDEVSIVPGLRLRSKKIYIRPNIVPIDW